jgi:hypothetical protein
MGPLIRLVGIVAAVWLPVYAIRCWWFPFGKCRRCKGAGTLADESKKHYRMCPRCHGNRRLRIGRRIWNHLNASRRAAR